MKYDVLMKLKIWSVIFCVKTSCSLVGEHKRIEVITSCDEGSSVLLEL